MQQINNPTAPVEPDSEADAAEAIKRIGMQLASRSCPARTHLLKLLEEAKIAFRRLTQSQIFKTSIKRLLDSLVKHRLLYNKDKCIRLLVGICISEVLRILAPEPDFGPRLSREIFTFLLNIFGELADVACPDFDAKVKILETVGKHRIMIHDSCQDLVRKMLKVFFSVVREDHSEDLLKSMALFTVSVLEEKVDSDYDEASFTLIDVVLQNIFSEQQAVPHSSFRLAVLVIHNRGVNLDRCICHFLKSCIFNSDAIESVIKEYYHEIIFELYQIAPQMLQSVIPSLTHELLIDQVDARIKALKSLKKLVFLPGRQFAREHPYVYVELLNRLSDKAPEVRCIALTCAKVLYTTAAFRGESIETLFSSVRDRLLDHHDKVRAEAVSVACELVNTDFSSKSMNLISCVAERLRDKKDFVRSKALKSLVDLYQEYCRRCEAEAMQFSDVLEEIPCNLLMLFYAKECPEFGPLRVDLLLADLFPASLSIKERTDHWMLISSLFKDVLFKVVLLKLRLQDWLNDYLETLDKAQKNSCGETDKKLEALVVKMSSCFSDTAKANAFFQRFKELKCCEIYNSFQKFLCNSSISYSKINLKHIVFMIHPKYPSYLQLSDQLKDAIVKEFGDQHELSEFFHLLSTKCSYNIFGLKHVDYIVDSLLHDDARANHLRNSSVHLLLVSYCPNAHEVEVAAIIIGVFPSLIRGAKRGFLELMEKGNIPFNEQLVDILVREGCHMSIELRDIYPSLEKICLLGTRGQAKLAVSVIAGSSDVSKGHFFSKLFKKLVDSLRGDNVGTVLQSLGCMSQYSSSALECHQVAITDYIFQEIFHRISPPEEHCTGEASKCCTACELKIFGLKALVRIFCPYDHTFIIICSIAPLLEVILQMLQNGRSSFGVFSCKFDNAFIRLAAAKSVLRLSRKWDFHISRQTFHLTILMAKDHSPTVRRSFTRKVHVLLKNHGVPIRYACAFSFAAVEDLRRDGFAYLEDFIREYSKEAQMLNTLLASNKASHPAYMVVYLIDILAHAPSFPSPGCRSENLWAQFLSTLFITVQALVSERLDDGSWCLMLDTYSFLRSIFIAIKKADDAIDDQFSPKLHLLADVGISILEALNSKSCEIIPPTPRLDNAYPCVCGNNNAMFVENLLSRLRTEFSGFDVDQIQELSIRQTGTRHVASTENGSKHTALSNQPPTKRKRRAQCIQESNADQKHGNQMLLAQSTTTPMSEKENAIDCDLISSIPVDAAIANHPRASRFSH
ncbi:hypothetical protein M569_09341 [Genlisea aurea]|uniref:Uncharacterized protein n=1 Tax=Genlisea aurea TaxID=192259 RepID=S8DZI9_9LAMI|nr:hypothetical protein M569_09341 [Genlisea aurea]